MQWRSYIAEGPCAEVSGGPLVIKQLSNSFAAGNGRSQFITVVRNAVVRATIMGSTKAPDFRHP